MRLTLPQMSAACLTLAIATFSAPSALAQAHYHVEQHWRVGGDGGWDYLLADAKSSRLYIAHGTRVDVVDTNSGKVLGAVTGLAGCHGIVIGADGKTGYISDGRGNAVVVFDTASFAVQGKIPTGTNPDGLLYEPTTNTVWAFNGGSKNATVISAADRSVVATIPLAGKPEFPATDGKGTVYVNIEDKNEIQALTASDRRLVRSMLLRGCESPSGLAIDQATGRLFSVCDGNKMAITDGPTGKQLGLATIGAGPDAAGFDPAHNLAFSSNGQSGTLTVVDASKPDYPVLETVVTARGARTMSFDSGNGKVYLVTSEFAKANPAEPKARPTPLPGSFGVLVVGR